MKLVLPVILSIVALVTVTCASETLVHYSPLEQEALRRLEVLQNYSDPMTLIPDELRTIFDPTAERIEEKPSLGSGVIPGFIVDGVKYVIPGVRFDGTVKLSIGGSVERTDRTIHDAICREYDEEFFGQLPLTKFSYATEKLIAGGFQLQDGRIVSEGWGPYITFFALETGYNLGEIQAAVEIMNVNAHLHFPVATFFSKISKLEASEIHSNAQRLLQAFESAAVKGSITPLKPEAKEMLLKLVENPAALPIEGGFGDFAKKYVHDYTEYSEFKLVTLDEFRRLPKKFSEAESSLALELFSNYRG